MSDPSKGSLPARSDIIVVGGGHNGLVAAAYLARVGLKVTVVERREIVGGCCVTEDLWPGYRVSTAAYLASLLQDRIVRDLELGRFGYHVEAKDPPSFAPVPDGRYLIFWQDLTRTLQEIARFSRRDAGRYEAYGACLERLAVMVDSLLLTTPPTFPPKGPFDFVDYLRVLGRLRGLRAADLSTLVKIFTQSAADFLDEWFESTEVKATLATDGVIGTNGGPRSAGTAYVLLHHCMGGVGGRRGVWGFVRGGMGAIAEAMAASARSRGALIKTSAPVARIVVRDRRATGVVLTSGEEIGARVVVSNLDPKTTFLHLVDETTLPPDFLESIRRYRCEGTSFKINFALGGLPKFAALPSSPGPHHRATMHLSPSIDYMERAWDDAKYGRPSQAPLVEMTLPTLYDLSLAPPGKHIMGVFVQYTPYTLAEGHWDAQRDRFVDRVIGVIEAYAPNVRGLIEHHQALSPLDLERRFGLWGGNIFHGEMSLDQLFVMRPVAGWTRYRTPIDGLYLCGSGAHPGGGVMGAPGYNAAREIVRDLRR
ncbi:MAG: phytoene desaturase family protein [Armatimonadota bacterium]